MIRATTGGVLKSYRSNLMNSFISMNKSRDTVLTQRKFNSYAEDPAAAAKAFRLRKSRMEVEAQHDVCNDTLKKFQSAWSCLESVSTVLDNDTGEYMSTIKGATLSDLNDPEGGARTQLSKALDQMSQTIVQTMNQKYGDNFIFAGADGHNVPFEIKDGKLYYRNVPVDAAVPKLMTDDNGDPLKVNANGEIDPAGEDYVSAKAELVKVPELVTMTGGGNVMVDENGQVDPAGTNYLLASTPTLDQTEFDAAIAAGEKVDDFSGYTADDGTIHYFRKADAATMSQAKYDDIIDNAMTDTNGDPYVHTVTNSDGSTSSYYIVKSDDSVITKEDYDTAVSDVEKLDYLMNKEKLFVDIGLGFKEADGKLIESSGFNAAINGLDFLGYGLDEDGDPKNIYSIVQRLCEISNSVPADEQWSKEVYDEFDGLVKKLEKASSNFHTEFTNFDAGTTKLENNEKLLTENFYNLQEQYAELEDVDMVDSITSFIWAQYCYNAALKVGNSILSESLMDYLS